MRVLIVTPTYGDLLLAECVASITAQTVDHDHVILREQVYAPPDIRNALEAYRLAWQMALAGGYDALATVEHDMVLPDSEALARMADTPGDVVYAPYIFRHGSHSLNLVDVIGRRTMGDSLSGKPDLVAEYKRAGWGVVGGVGWGCTLIRRHVVSSLSLRGNERGRTAGDVEFAYDALAAGFMSTARMDAACWHVEHGVWIHPDHGVRYGVNVRAKRKFNCKVAGQFVRVAAGQEFETDRRMANEFATKGIVEILGGRNG